MFNSQLELIEINQASKPRDPFSTEDTLSGQLDKWRSGLPCKPRTGQRHRDNTAVERLSKWLQVDSTLAGAPGAFQKQLEAKFS